MYDSSEPADNFAYKWKNIELTAAVQSPRQTFSGKLYLIFAYLSLQKLQQSTLQWFFL